jgi:hypothetical protein
MRKEPSEQLLEFLGKAAESVGAEGLTVSMPIICDHCKDEEREAFPYYVKDKDGKDWDHLCNDSYDELGCDYGLDEE